MFLIRALDNGSILKYCRSGLHTRYAVWGVCFALILVLSACNSKKNLLDDQSFLMGNKIKIKSEYPVSGKSELIESLSNLYSQPETKYSLGFPRHVFYYEYQRKLAKNPNKKEWDPNRVIKNKPVLYDSLKTKQTSENFSKSLQLKGYRSPSVWYKAKTANKKTNVVYTLDPGSRLMIDTIVIIAEDSVLQDIVDEGRENSILVEGSPLDNQLYNQEKQRLVRLLQNQGYATFDESYVSQLEVDTSNNKVSVVMRLLNPTDSTFHLKYRVGNVNVYPDYDIVATPIYYDTVVNQIRYFLPDTNVFTLKPDAISRNLFLRPGAYTSRDDLDHTIKNIGRIELIRFVKPSGDIDTTNAEAPTIDYTFLLTRNKKINTDFNGELTYSNIASANRKSLFGTSFSTNYRDRNIFKRAEVFSVNAELGFEFNFFRTKAESNEPFLNSLNAGLGTDLSFQRLMDPLGLYRMIGYSKDRERKALFGSRLHQWLVEDATSRLNLGFNYVIITDLYDYYNVNANLSYNIQPDVFKKLTITRVGFDLFVPTAKPDYQTILDENKFLQESFGNQLYTGLIFRNYLYEVNSKVKAKSGYFKVLHSAELSGIEMYAINSIANAISGNFKEFVLNPGDDPANSVEFSQFVKGEIDIRYYRDLSPTTNFAIKFNTGIASIFGPYTEQVPYPKQFFVGGALSNRAWQIRELGPGGFQDTAEIPPNVPFYQTGDFKIDMSAELRFKLFWYFNGVIFLDAANVWILKDDETRPGALLSNNFYKEFGIGYGYGIRLDLDFFIIRFDLGYKLHNPYPVLYDPNKDPSRWLVNELKKFPSGAEPQIAVGLPF